MLGLVVKGGKTEEAPVETKELRLRSCVLVCAGKEKEEGVEGEEEEELRSVDRYIGSSAFVRRQESEFSSSEAVKCISLIMWNTKRCEEALIAEETRNICWRTHETIAGIHAKTKRSGLLGTLSYNILPLCMCNFFTVVQSFFKFSSG